VKKGIIILFLSLPLFIGCLVGKNRNPYRDQQPLFCKHNPKYDLKKHKKIKYGIFVLNSNHLPQTEISRAVEESLEAVNLKHINILQYNDIINIANQKRQLKRINKINNTFKQTSVILEKDLRIIGRKLKLNYFLIPEIVNVNFYENNKPFVLDRGGERGGFNWYPFQIYYTEMYSSIQIKLKLFDVKKGKLTENYQANGKLVDMFDTTSTYDANKRAIAHENTKRFRENERRRKTLNKREEEVRKGKKKSSFLDDLDYLLDEHELENIKQPAFKKPLFLSRSEYSYALCIDSFGKAFRDVFGKFAGMSIKGDTVNGKGVYKFINGDLYSGQWQNSQAHGQGKYTYITGEIYEGDFLNGIAHGSGTFIDRYGNKYIGPYVNGSKHGEGTMTFAHNNNTVKCITANGVYKKFAKATSEDLKGYYQPIVNEIRKKRRTEREKKMYQQ
jgi:hypothetical protein